MRKSFRESKKVTCLLLILVLLISMPAFALGSSTNLTLSNVPHMYDIKPGTSEWVNMTVDERLASCKVSKEEVDGMTTAALIETIVNYPYMINIYAYDSIEKGISMVSNHFPGLAELLSRSDAAVELNKYLITTASKAETDNPGITYDYASTLLCVLEGFSSESNMQRGCVTLYTPSLYPVSATTGLTWQYHGLALEDNPYYTEYNAINKNNTYKETYPNIVEIASVSPEYNCHSYAWHHSSPSNIYWIDDCTPYTSDPRYVVSTAASGRKVTYSIYSSIEHSGVVSYVSGSTVMVRSKWGPFGLFEHALYDCPYAVDTNINGSITSYGYVQYWKLV